MVSEYVSDKIEPGANERNNNSEYPEEIIADLGNLGYFGLFIPKEQGGNGRRCRFQHDDIERIG